MTDTRDMGCEQALARLMEYLDRELPGAEHEGLERHLRTCRSCFSRMEFERRLKARLSSLADEDVPEASRRRIRDLIRGF
jgi:anti-sigma factor (TIGR02949 family)